MEIPTPKKRGKPSKKDTPTETVQPVPVEAPNSILNPNSNPSNTTMNNKTESRQQRVEVDKKITNILDNISYWTTLVISIPFRLFAGGLEMFVTKGMPGTKTLGALVFFFGVAYTADGYWQMNGYSPIFPLFAGDEWNGWSFLWLLSPFFWFVFMIVLAMQLAQSECFRGLTPKEAKERMQQASEFDEGSVPQGKIKIASIYHKQYVNAGVRYNKLLSLIALGTLTVDFVVAFAARNPLEYQDFGMFWVITLWNIVSLVLSEVGYAFWKANK